MLDLVLSGKRPWVLVALLGCFLYLPFLGTTGLWDPWETHYAEVAREMVESGNWVEPTWEHSPGQSFTKKYFFSKPILIFWMMAIPMKIFGVHSPDGGILPGVEWYLRFPFALTAILGLLAVFGLANRFFGPRVGLLAAVILGTCPQYGFVSRQVMTDMPLVGFMTAGMALLLIGGFDRDQPRPVALYAGYAFLGLAVLAKGLSGFLVPGLVFLLYFLVTGDWARLARMRVISGGLLALAVAAPWFVYLSLASCHRNLLDDESKLFFYRFMLHDHVYRLGSGVHGDRGTFAYFIEQLGLGSHPWFPFMVWGSVRSAAGVDQSNLDRSKRVELFVLLWAMAGFCLYALSITKFHHYALPILPAAAILAALWLVRAFENPAIVGRWVVPLVLVLGVVLISRDIGLMPKNIVDLFVYKYTREFPKEAAVPGQIGYSLIFGLLAASLAGLFLFRRPQLFRAAPFVLAAGGVLGALWSGWFFFTSMGPHWSQRHLFDSYFALRQADEPIGAYRMNWRGETFYSRNTVIQIKTNSHLKSWLEEHRGQRVFLLTESEQLEKLKEQLSPTIQRSLRILDRTCNKFFLLSVESTAEPAAPVAPAPMPPPAPGPLDPAESSDWQ